MADKKNLRKRRGFPWLLLAALAMAVFAFYRVLTTTDTPQPEQPVEPAVPETSAPPVASHGDSLTLSSSREDSIRYYVSRLGDSTFTSSYGDGFTWYIAAEELGLMGRPAIPSLIAALDTDDDYTRTQALYALRLASQHRNMQELTKGAYVDLVADAFPPPEAHPALVAAWKDWYRHYFETTKLTDR
jgi:hypothetical protein